ncbi:pyridoxal phosphate-dependent aminotransferase family protein [bacterium SCSIO 12643]|nr:pyridoxal phosphate-dependent aminotransferase family protein [bacterium SCSIO 12643]
MEFLNTILKKRETEGLKRNIKPSVTGIDFCSNDYLGLARSSKLHQDILDALHQSDFKNGATGSRLLSGNNEAYEELEQHIASFHDAEAALIYPSGYQANIGLLQCIAGKGDTLILDELAHASLIDGARLSHAKRFKFQHNNLDDLQKKLAQASGKIFVVIEALYSMNGDVADVESIVQICTKYNAHVIVDEAHSAAVYGTKGQGLTFELGLQHKVFARIITYGKGFGSHGAAIIGSRTLIDYLINFSRSFIYSTGLSPVHLESIKTAYQHVKESTIQRERLFEVITYFRSKILENASWLYSSSAIQSLVIPGNSVVKAVALQLNKSGISVFPILSPTVAKGSERIRFCLHSYNTKEEIDHLFLNLERIL